MFWKNDCHVNMLYSKRVLVLVKKGNINLKANSITCNYWPRSDMQIIIILHVHPEM